MGRLLLFSGIILIIVAVIYLVLLLAGKEIEATGKIIESMVCEPGESLDQTYTEVSNMDGNATSIDYYCVDVERGERDVTFKIVIAGILGFTGLLGGGIVMTIIGAQMLAKRATAQWTETFITNPTMGNMQSSVMNLHSSTSSQYQVKNPEEVQTVLKQVFSQMGQAVGGGSLADKLRQLDEARQQGLISQAEYDRVRQGILDGMDD